MAETTPMAPNPQPVKKLYRSQQNRVLGGVCGGLGEHFNLDPIIFRVLFVVLTLFWGGGLILYIILELFMKPNPNQPPLKTSVFTKIVLIAFLVLLFGFIFLLLSSK